MEKNLVQCLPCYEQKKFIWSIIFNIANIFDENPPNLKVSLQRSVIEEIVKIKTLPALKNIAVCDALKVNELIH